MNRLSVRDAGIPLLSGITVFLLFLLFNALYGIFPCGSNSIVWCDMEQQAVPLLMQLKQLLQNGETIAYSPYAAGGMEFYGIFFFFLSNPCSFLILLTDMRADLVIVLMVIIKLALSSVTAAVWLQYRVKDVPAGITLLLSIMYGCSGYGLFYYQNLMWLDIMVMVPLLLCAVRILLTKGKPLPYMAALSLSVILCFYLGYMVVLFVLLYTALSIRFIVPAEQRGTVARRFWGASILAACLTAFVWLPCLIQVMHSARGTNVVRGLLHSYLLNHIGDRFCVLAATAAGFAAIPLLWKQHTGTLAEQKRDRRLFLLLFAAFVCDPVNMMWHGGSYQAFPLRWGMFPVLLLLTAAADQLSERGCKQQEKRGLPSGVSPVLLFAGIPVLALFGVSMYFRYMDVLHAYITTLWTTRTEVLLIFIWSLLLAAAYWIVFTGRQRRALSVRACTVLMAGLFLCEFTMNYACYFGGAANDDHDFVRGTAPAGAIHPDTAAERVKLSKKYSHPNLLGGLGYPTLAHYTSLTREDFMQGVKRFGYSSYWMEVTSPGGTVLSDALWNIRYEIGTEADFGPWSEVLWNGDEVSAIRSLLSMPPVYFADAEPQTLGALPDGSRADVQQYLAETYLGLSDAVVRYEITSQKNAEISETENGIVCTPIDPNKSGEIEWSAYVPDMQTLYFDLYTQTGTAISNPRKNACDIYVNGRCIAYDYPNNNHNGLICLGTFGDEYVTVRIRPHHSFSAESFGVFGMRLSLLDDAMQNAEGAELRYARGVYTAECRADAPKTAVFAVAYDEGFTAEVNGEPAEVYRVNGCQTAVRIPAGTSTVRLIFHVQGLRTSLWLGLAGLLLAAAYLLLRKRIPARLRERTGRASYLLLQTAYILLLLAVYGLPVLLSVTGIFIK